jgi:acetyl-CoA C-acetyltransferase
VLVGVGVAQQRCDDPVTALEPVALMVAALEAAARDAGVTALPAQADSIRIPRGFWAYSDPGRLVADRIGATAPRSVLAEIGVLQQTLLSDACAAIASGREEVALVTGGDTRYRNLRAQLAGIEVSDTAQADGKPDVVLAPAESLWADLEFERGLMMASSYYAIMENALRFSRGQTLAEHRDAIAALWSRMSEVAANNPHAAHRAPVAAATIREASERNAMVAFPYTKLHISDWNVDQAAGLILCSVAKARACGIPEDRWVYPLSGTESNLMLPLSNRAQLHRCPAIAIAGGRALDLAHRRVDEIAHLDLYSCFPVAAQVFALELGIDPERQLTVTGGMRFAGGPLNNYVLQATARMAEVLRGDPGSTGLVTAVSGFLTKQGFGVWSTAPPTSGFHFEDCTAAAAAATPTRRLEARARGTAVIAGCTVLYQKGEPSKAVAICDLADGARTVVESADVELMRAMTREEFCGRSVRVSEDGGFAPLA